MEFFALEGIGDPATWVQLVTLAGLEIVLGVDNLVFIAILTERLPPEKRSFGRRLGLALALVTRLILLATIAWIVSLTAPFVQVFGFGLSWRDVILLGGGLFLIYKATQEIHAETEGEPGEHATKAVATATVGVIVTQIAFIDIIFSLDSVITAVGMADHLWVMVAAIMIAMALMITAANPLSEFVSRHPTVKMLALSFLLLIGTVLIADGLHFHIPKGYVYSALAFSLIVESLNFRARRRQLRRRLIE
ncbi:MAG TPA: TerC family protein [Usitatibacter sp.]|jgi:predicted tellurium resistance membrane protein TerC|nr:TerC family protein [Usitatibacter sp.]